MNSRDFLAALNRFVAVEGGETMRDQELRIGDFNCGDLSLLVSFVKNKEKKESPFRVSEDIVKALNHCLTNPIA